MRKYQYYCRGMAQCLQDVLVSQNGRQFVDFARFHETLPIDEKPPPQSLQGNNCCAPRVSTHAPLSALSAHQLTPAVLKAHLTECICQIEHGTGIWALSAADSTVDIGYAIVCAGDVQEPMTPTRSRCRSPDQAKVQHADILGHFNELAKAGTVLGLFLQDLQGDACLCFYSSGAKEACFTICPSERTCSDAGCFPACPMGDERISLSLH